MSETSSTDECKISGTTRPKRAIRMHKNRTTTNTSATNNSNRLVSHKKPQRVDNGSFSNTASRLPSIQNFHKNPQLHLKMDRNIYQNHMNLDYEDNDEELQLAIAMSLNEERPNGQHVDRMVSSSPPFVTMYPQERPGQRLAYQRSQLRGNLLLERRRQHQMFGDINYEEALALENMYFGSGNAILANAFPTMLDSSDIGDMSDLEAATINNTSTNTNNDMSYEVLSQLEDVKVGVPCELLSLIPSFQYDESMKIVQCPICLCDYEKRDHLLVVPCTHVFHQDCVLKWLSEHKTCPVCKVDVAQHLDES